MIASPGALDAVASEIPATFRDSVGELRRRVAEGCIVCLARRASKEVVGYELAERGVFSALGRRRTVAATVIFFALGGSVAPSWRGQRIHGRHVCDAGRLFLRPGRQDSGRRVLSRG